MLSIGGWRGSPGPHREGTHEIQRVEESGLIKRYVFGLSSVPEMELLKLVISQGQGVIGTALKKKKKRKYLFIFDCAGSSLLCKFSLVVVSRGYSLAVVRGPLIPVVSLGVEPVGCVA